MNPIIQPDLLEAMMKERKVRTALTKESHLYFFNFYFAHYVKYQTAPFQREMFTLTENEELGSIFIVAFRGSGKSTILTTSYPLWAILGKPQKKFVLILCQTVGQAKLHMMNLRSELEHNDLLKGDLRPFEEEAGEWGSSSLVFSDSGARITVASSEQSIRGLRHNQHRPDLIICDDVEDMQSAKTREGRQKIYAWLTGEVIPCGDLNTRLVVVGNLLHEDSLLMKLARDVEEKRLSGVFRKFPLIDENNKITWPGKYPDHAAIEQERQKVGNDIAWKREYLLVIIPDEDQAIDPSWIVYYDNLPDKKKPREIIAGTDLAISEKSTADCTAVVVGYVYGHEKGFRVYIQPNPTNERLNFPATISRLTAIQKSYAEVADTTLYIEDVGYQRAVVDQLTQNGVPAESIRVAGDKRSRLITISNLIKIGKIRFPRKGAEQLIEQIVGFGVEKHDDLVDAFTIVGHKAIEMDEPVPCFGIIDMNSGHMEWTPLGDTSDDY